MKSQSVLLRALLTSLVIAQGLALVTYQLRDATLVEGLHDTVVRLAWALVAWLGIMAWGALSERRTVPGLAPSPSTTREIVRATWDLDTPTAPPDEPWPAEVRAAVAELYGRSYEEMHRLACAHSSPEDLHAYARSWILACRRALASGTPTRVVAPAVVPSYGSCYDHRARRPRPDLVWD